MTSQDDARRVAEEAVDLAIRASHNNVGSPIAPVWALDVNKLSVALTLAIHDIILAQRAEEREAIAKMFDQANEEDMIPALDVAEAIRVRGAK